jgi:hypothetical protein
VEKEPNYRHPNPRQQKHKIVFFHDGYKTNNMYFLTSSHSAAESGALHVSLKMAKTGATKNKNLIFDSNFHCQKI